MTVCAVPSAQAAWWWPFGDKSIKYEIDIRGVDGALMKWLKELKLDQPDETRPIEVLDDLTQESVSLAQKISKALAARGYYDAVVRQQVFKKKEPPLMRFHVTPGVAYTIKAVKIEWAQRAPKQLAGKITPDLLGSKKGAKPFADIINGDAEILFKAISDKTCMLSLEVTPVLKLYPQRVADVVFQVKHGPEADFGSIVVKGNPTVKNELILRAVKWKQGECFDEKKLNQTQTSLIQNPLLSTARVTAGDKVDAKGQVPITIAVAERVPRTITAGMNFSTDQGVGVTAGWEHRNFFGNAEKFNTVLTLAQQEQSLQNSLRIPYFMHDSQTLALNAGLKRENTDVYTANTLNFGGTLERRLSKKWNAGIGAAYTLTQSEDALTGGTSKYGLLSLPAFVEYDGRDDLLDTKDGTFARVTATPYTETFGDGGQFIKTQGTWQHYRSFDVALKPTIALRATAGSIAGADGSDVPSDIRFYAGGGGSVRGYSFQSLSPRVGNEPVGGNSMVAGSTELRVRFTETIGAVAFFDAGNAYEESYPDIGEKLYYAAGVGGRYYSAVGPVRFDIGVPLNGKDIGETGFQVYVSLGQAF